VSEQARLAGARYIPGPFEIVPNGVDLVSNPDPGGRLDQITFVGRHEPRKGLQVLLRAWPMIAAATGTRLRVIGADPLQVRFLMRRLGVEDSIDILGVVPRAMLEQELRSTKVLVAPSIGGESFGMVITEAFSCATPVVASCIPGYMDVVDDETGALVPAGDPDALAAAVVGLLRDEARRRELALAGRLRAEERYGWGRIAGRLVGIYELLTGLRSSVRVATP
jgi:phosphatidylinositol alpha-mannosyltransferase